MKSSNPELQIEKNNLKDQLQRMKQEQDRALAELEAKNTELTALQEELQKTRNALTDRDTKLLKAEEEVFKLKDENEELRKKLSGQDIENSQQQVAGTPVFVEDLEVAIVNPVQVASPELQQVQNYEGAMMHDDLQEIISNCSRFNGEQRRVFGIFQAFMRGDTYQAFQNKVIESGNRKMLDYIAKGTNYITVLGKYDWQS